MLVGGRWVGRLTYLDYSSNEKTTIRTALQVEAVKPGKPVWTFSYFYPDEPHANSSSKVKIKANGRRINRETVLSKTLTTDGTTVIITQRKKAKLIFRYTYRISPEVFSIRKEEADTQSPGVFTERNTYYFEKEIPVTEEKKGP